MKNLTEYITEHYMDDDEYEKYKSSTKINKKQNLSDTDNNIVKEAESWYDKYFIRNGSEEFIIDDNNKIAINSDKNLLVQYDNWTCNKNVYFNTVKFDNKDLLNTFLNKCKGTFVFPKVLTISEDNFYEDFPITIKHADNIVFPRGCVLWSLNIESMDNMNIMFNENIVFPREAQKFNIDAENANVVFKDNTVFDYKDDGEPIYIKCNKLEAPSLECTCNLYLRINDTLNVKKIKLNKNKAYGNKFELSNVNMSKQIKIVPMYIESTDSSITFDGVNSNYLMNISLENCVNCDVKLIKCMTTALPVAPEKMSKNKFELTDIDNLKTLTNVPKKCRTFLCSKIGIKTLQDAPKYTSVFSCSNCDELTDITGPVVADLFSIVNCKNLKSLNNTLTDCEEVHIENCPNINSIKQLPNNLYDLKIENCGREFSNREIAMHKK